MPRKSPARRSAKARGYRSGLEEKVADQIKKKGLTVRYENPEDRISFVQPEIARKYTPDFVLPNGIIVETKGRFVTEDRKKHIWIREQYGDKYDIRFVFTNSRQKLYKGAKSTYAMWCEKNGFKYADKLIPEEWFDEH